MSTGSAFVVREKDVSGHLTSLYAGGDKVVSQVEDSKNQTREVIGLLLVLIFLYKLTCRWNQVPRKFHTATPRNWRHFLGEVFLPEGYPATVSEGKCLSSIVRCLLVEFL